MRPLFLFVTFLAVLTGCGNDPFSGGEDEYPVFPSPGSSSDPILTGFPGTDVQLVAVESVELPGVPSAAGEEEYLCLWISGTYNETGEWDWEDVVESYTVGSDGTLEIETVNALCDPIPGELWTALAVYYPPTTSKVLDYDILGTLDWGDLPGLPSGWCWILMVDWSWSDIPHSHGLSIVVDWASAYNHGPIPPVLGICGWPLVGNPPAPFTIHGI